MSRARTLDTLRLTAEEATGLLERREVSARELWDAYRAAIDERDEELHCFLTLVDEPEREGVPIALKDVIGTQGIETTAGSKILKGYVPVYDSTVAARCKDAGLVTLGKTNTDEFAMGSSTENSAFGPSHNPWDPSRVPGGSGGGSAAAVAGGLAPWALGSDTGGSIKQPAALCGIVGLRPTYGTVSRYGIVAFASSLDQVGPTTKTVRDCALLYRIIAGRDACDSTTADVPEVELPEREDLKGVRVGVPRQMIELEAIEPGVREAVERPRPHPTSRATTACATGRAWGTATTTQWSCARATRASATSRSGASCSGRTRSLPATTRRTTGRRRRCAP